MPVAMPTSTPRALARGHRQQEADIAERCDYEAGEPRLATLYRSVPNVVDLSWRLTQAQMTDFHNWFEADLHAGHLSFNVPIAEQGSTGVVTVEAMFLAPPTYTAQQGGFWLVAGRVITGVPLESFGLEPVPAGLSVGWASPIFGGTYAHANSGTGSWYLGGPVTIYTPTTGPIYARVIDYVSGTVVWSPVWAPLSGDPAPTTNAIGAGGSLLQVSFANLGFPERTSAGLLTLSATVDGVPTIDSVQIAVAAGAYNSIAWGPTP